MSKLRILAIALGWFLAGETLFAQATNTNQFFITVLPPAGTNLISESTNAIFVTLTNRDIFTNITVNGYVDTNVVQFSDNGTAPDQTADDGTFTGNLIVPFTLTVTNLNLMLVLRGEDLTATNAVAPETNDIMVTTTNRISYRILPRPANNAFTNAVKVPAAGGVLLSSNYYATLEPGEPVHAQVPSGSSSVWFNWSPLATTNVLIDTAGSSFHPVLAVYTGDSVDQLTEVASSTDDRANNLLANVSFNAIKGTTYRIAVAGFDAKGEGNIRLRVAPGGTPDTRPPLVSISSPMRESLVTTGLVTVSGTVKEPATSDSGVSNVFLQINGGPATNVTVIGQSWYGMVTLPPGTNLVQAYAIDYAGNQGPADTIVVRYINPTNDFFAFATPLPGVGGIVTAINGRATVEPGEPLHGDNAGGHSIWYTWQAPADGTLTLSTSGSSFDTLLGMYIGTNVTNLITVVGNDDAYQGSKYSQINQQPVMSNQVYYIAVDGYGGASGNITLQYAFVAPKPGQYYVLTVTTTAGGTAFPPSGTYPSNALVTLTATPDSNFEFVGWSGTVTSPNNPLAVRITQDTTVTSRFRLKAAIATDDFETGNLKKIRWGTSTPNAVWVVQTNSASGGKYAARSAVIEDNQRSSLLIVTNLLTGVGSFDVRVSSEPGWDFLEFWLNKTNLLQRWSGEVPWTNFLFNVTAGTNTMEWIYVKDAGFSSAEDAAYLDNVFLPLNPTNAVLTAPKLSLVPMSSGHGHIVVQGQPNQMYRLEVSLDLNVWLTLASGSSASGVVQFTDDYASSYARRYYRAVSP